MDSLVSVVLINYNGNIDTMECVRSLLNCTYKNIKIIIVDNASKNKIQYNNVITKEKCIIIHNQINIGFSGANNVGIDYALNVLNSDFVLLLNNDTEVTPNFLEPLVDKLVHDSNIGLVSGKIYYYDEPKLLYYGGGYYSKKHHICDIDGYQKEEENINNIEREVPYATGCMWLFKSQVLKEVGHMCEDYFLYYEDNDYCEQIKKIGYKIYYVPSSVIYHKESRSTKSNLDLYNYYLIRNYLLYIKRNLCDSKFLKYKFILRKIIITMYDVLRKNLKFKVAFFAIWDFCFSKFGKSNRF